MLDLEAIERIKQLKARYFRFLDTGNLEGLKSVFTDDAAVDYKSPSYHIQFQGWAELEGFFQQAFTQTRFGMHHGHHPEIMPDGDKAVGLWYLHDIFINLDDKTRFEGSAIYRDDYVKVDGHWKIHKSAYERLFEQITPLSGQETVTAIPVGNRFAADEGLR